VVPDGCISPSDLGIWKDAHVENLARVVRFLRQHGALAGTQLAQAGFKASTGAPWRNHGAPVPIADGGWRPIYSSTAKGFTLGDAKGCTPESIQPEALTPEGIARITTEAGNRTCETEPAGQAPRAATVRSMRDMCVKIFFAAVDSSAQSDRARLRSTI
jgi:2,4-dienoyl-CoA reductase-like NADH-dependent reductase (Old Yellow Enzyme family)